MLSAPKILPTKWALLLSNLPVNNFLQSTMSQGQVSIHFTKCVNTDCTMSVKAVSLTLTPSLLALKQNVLPALQTCRAALTSARAFAVVTSVQGTISPQIPVHIPSSRTCSLTLVGGLS